MARINIEDDFWIDITSLMAKLGNEDQAIGMTVRWFRYSQNKHRQSKLVTESDFASAGFSEHLIPTFATRVQGGIQARGADKHFGWLAKKSAAGKAGGDRSVKERRKRDGSAVPKNASNSRSKTEADRSTTEPSYSPSYSPSPSSSDSNSSLFPSETADADATRAWVAAYCEKFKIRWGTGPDVMGKDIGILQRLGARPAKRKDKRSAQLSFAKFKTLLDAYFQMPDAYLVKAKHPVNLFELKLNEIGVFANSGKFTTMSQVRQADSMATTHALLRKVREQEASK